jgi:hypothetical protein
MQLTDLVGIFEQYRNASVANPPQNVQQDYQRAAEAVPSSHLADALGEAFRSRETPAFSQMVCSLFANSNPDQRAVVLNHLLSAVQQLAEHAEKQNPSVIDHASQFYSQHPKLVQALGAGSLALIMSHLSRR